MPLIFGELPSGSERAKARTIRLESERQAVSRLSAEGFSEVSGRASSVGFHKGFGCHRGLTAFGFNMGLGLIRIYG